MARGYVCTEPERLFTYNKSKSRTNKFRKINFLDACLDYTICGKVEMGKFQEEKDFTGYTGWRMVMRKLDATLSWAVVEL